jgi:hypothetical protein
MKIPIASSNSKTISRTSREVSKPPKAKKTSRYIKGSL